MIDGLCFYTYFFVNVIVFIIIHMPTIAGSPAMVVGEATPEFGAMPIGRLRLEIRL